MLEEMRICIPILIMIEGLAKLERPEQDYAHARESVRKIHNASVPILVGMGAHPVRI